MTSWITRAVTLASLAVGLGAGPALATGPASRQATKQASVAMITLDGTPTNQPGPLDWLIASGEPITLQDYVDLLSQTASDRDVQAVVLRLKDAGLNTAQIEELGSAIKRVQHAGKTVHLFAENYGTAEILLGSMADEAIIQRGGAVSLPGLAMTELYLADTFAWLGIQADFVQIGDYKGANEMFMRSEPSRAWDENISSLLDSRYAIMRRIIAQGRDLSDAELDKAMAELWWASDRQAIELGVLDAAVDLPELKDHLAAELDARIAWTKPSLKGGHGLDLSSPFAFMQILTSSPDHTPKGDTIAVLHIDGTIVDGDSSLGGIFGGTSTGSRTVRNALEDIRKHEQIGGLVVRIDSPGGSAIASEIIWQGLRRVAEVKPVYISVGSMAASGGYYIAVGGDQIYVDPSSIVGSIGVVGGKLALGGLLDKAHIHTHTRTRGPMAGMLNPMTPWTSEQRELVRQKMTETYNLFTSRVEQGRPGIDLATTAEGRLFTGDQAIDMKMADEVGTLTDTIEAMADRVGFESYDIMHYPGPKGLEELISEMLGGFVSAPRVGTSARQPGALIGEMGVLVRELVGPQAWPMVRDQLEAISIIRREPVLLIVPRTLIFN